VAVGGRLRFDMILPDWVFLLEFLGKRKVYFVLWHNVAESRGRRPSAAGRLQERHHGPSLN